MTCPGRIYPLRQPPNHKPPVPRWRLVLPDDVDHVYTAYLGVQRHGSISDESSSEAASQAIEAVRAWVSGTDKDKPLAVEEFTVLDGDDARNAHTWVCYWTDEAVFKHSLERLSLRALHASLPEPGRNSVGIWLETLTSLTSRVETNYSGLDYLPGLGALPGTTTEAHTLTAYWGAARDRIPDSGVDLFEKHEDAVAKRPETPPRGKGQHLVGANHDNLVHIRSGQFWANCGPEEVEAYESKLEPTLRAGLAYLWENAGTVGVAGLRYLRNEPSGGESGTGVPGERDAEAKETCVTGFFSSLDSLEGWAKSHRSHLAIYTGAIRHAKEFGEERKFRTWHEVSVLKRGEARFEYLNCRERTGVMELIALDEATT